MTQYDAACAYFRSNPDLVKAMEILRAEAKKTSQPTAKPTPSADEEMVVPRDQPQMTLSTKAEELANELGMETKRLQELSSMYNQLIVLAQILGRDRPFR